MTPGAREALARALGRRYAEAVLHRPGVVDAHDCDDAFGRPLCRCRPDLYTALDADGLPAEGNEGRIHLIPPGEGAELEEARDGDEVGLRMEGRRPLDGQPAGEQEITP